jgi:hypothetical protein
MIRQPTEAAAELYEAVLGRIDQYRWYCAGVLKNGRRHMFCTAADRTFEIPDARMFLTSKFAPHDECADNIHTRSAMAALPFYLGGIKSFKVWFRLDRPDVEEMEWSPDPSGFDAAQHGVAPDGRSPAAPARR